MTLRDLNSIFAGFQITIITSSFISLAFIGVGVSLTLSAISIVVSLLYILTVYLMTRR